MVPDHLTTTTFKMIDSSCQFPINNIAVFKLKMLSWLHQFNIFCLLENNGYQNGSFECMLAIAGDEYISLSAGTAFESLKIFHEVKPSWLFGHLGYDLKNEDPRLHSSHNDPIHFADGFFFRPQILIILKDDHVVIHASDPEKIFHEILSQSTVKIDIKYSYSIKCRISKEEYLQSLSKLKSHIQRGDCYEINFCQEFYIEDAEVDPAVLYHQLSAISPNPFAAFYRVNDQYCISASPERFLKKTNQHLLSQPIKGTVRRSSDPVADKAMLADLQNSEKDKSENVMIVDLVRNDLSKVCTRNSVHATTLFEVKAYPQVYQMISTIEGELKNIHWTEALKATFPMGSMTGAPKHRVMQLIEQYESSKRGLYSGSIGYINPQGDFDFNVIIRSIFYNQQNKYVSFWAGGGITIKSDAEKEYEECLLKIKAIRNILE